MRGCCSQVMPRLRGLSGLRVAPRRRGSRGYRDVMARIIVAEVCPACGSLDVQPRERWFHVDVERRDAIDAGWIDALEFACRDCLAVWI